MYMCGDDIPSLVLYAARMLVAGSVGLALQARYKAMREVEETAKICKVIVAIFVSWHSMI